MGKAESLILRRHLLETIIPKTGILSLLNDIGRILRTTTSLPIFVERFIEGSNIAHIGVVRNVARAF